jgi:LuxR family transcriptional regulator, maltose regulon positive regulatory protein
MPPPLLLTKLYVPPPRPNAVLRPRLVERLRSGLHRKLTLISAPAGSGKTTLVSEWTSICGRPVAWLSLDDGDNDPARFLTYLVAALQQVSPGVGAGVMAALQAPQPPATEALLISLINEITTVPDRFILVLDDYHAVDSQPVDEDLTFLLAHLPPQMHLVIATREDPHLPLAQYRAQGQLTELRAADLRFTPLEAADFLNQSMGLNLSEPDIAALDARTEGWIAGLQLAALSMQGQSDHTGFIQAFTGSHHFVLDYLIEEVLHQQSAGIQAFLLRTSILDRLCGPLCDAVLLDPGCSGQDTLETLERANLFLVALDNERRWYRYHHLFGELLRQRSGQKFSPAEIGETHLRASRWYEANGDWAEAFRHAFAAGDHTRAAGIAELAWHSMDSAFQSAAWLGWVKKLPHTAVQVRPVLSAQAGIAFMDAGEPEASELHLLDAERCLDGPRCEMIVTDESQLETLPAMIAITRAYNAQVLGDYSATVKYAERALQLLPETDLFRRAQATITLEMTHWAMGELEAATQAMRTWMQSMERAGNFVFVVASASALADIQVEQGRLREAVRTYQQALQLAAEQGAEAQQITAHHYLGLAMLYHETGQDALRDEHLEKAQEMGEKTTLVDWPYRWRIAQARLRESAGDLQAALALLDEARHVYIKNPIPDTHPVDALKANLYLKQGRLDQARAWVRERGISAADEIIYLNEFSDLVFARVLIAEYRTSRIESSLVQAVGLLERLQKAAEAQHRVGRVIETLAALSLAYQAQGNLPLARSALARALDLAQPEGYLRLFVDSGEPMRLLLLDYQSSIEKQPGGQSHTIWGDVDRLISAFDRSGLEQSTANPKNSSLVEPLSERELEVLRLIAKGLSNTEISQRLVLALSTVKGHNLRIFGKLQVQNRTEAVVRARDLGLL